MKLVKKILTVGLLVTFMILIPWRGVVFAGTVTSHAEIVRVITQDEVVVAVDSGSDQNKRSEYKVKTFADNYQSKPKYLVGDRVIVSIDKVGGKNLVSIVERDRTIPYVIVFAFFIGVIALIGRFKGVLSIIAMIASFLFLYSVTLPQIIAGSDPILMSMLTGFIIVPLTFYISHGLSMKTTLAVIATIISLAVTGLLAVSFSNLAYLTGYTTDEATAVAFRFGDDFKMSNILIAGMIIGSMGVLDDVTISQVDIVYALSKAKPDMRKAALFAEAMKIGRDHIASLVNTLVLVYMGAALPLFLVIYESSVPIWTIFQKESIAEEIVRTIVASTGIILAVPVATFLAVRWGRKKVGFLQREKLFN
jgi:uncharacterized membrane protein